ncbi:MAG: roadblock/LC7 domain-containing protein [Armatimonadetes bacterium]|nr:roadblock/LC7 domain-containing protein [Armatimonadota bacterium]
MPEMETILEELNRNPAVEGALVVGARDGLLIAAAGEPKPDAEFLAAETLELFSSADSGMNEKFSRGSLDCLSLEGDYGHLFLKSINSEFYLLVLARNDTNLGMVRLDVRRASEALRDEL